MKRQGRRSEVGVQGLRRWAPRPLPAAACRVQGASWIPKRPVIRSTCSLAVLGELG